VKKVTFIVVVTVLAVGLVFSGCAKTAPAPSGPEEIIIGCNVPLTGSNAGFGEGVFGERAAVEDINKLGGVYVKEYGRKLPIKLIVVDNESDPTKSGSLAENLILHEKVHLSAPPNQSLTLDIPQANMAEKYKVPRVTGGCPMEPWLSLRADSASNFKYTWAYGFSIVTPAPPGSIWDTPGYTIMDTWVAMLDLFGNETNKTVGVFASDEPDGRGWYALFPPALEDLGYDAIGVERNLGLFPPGTTDFSPMIEEWKDHDCQILWGNCIAPEFGTLWRQCHELGFKPKMVAAGRAALYYTDISAWGGDLPWGIGIEMWWSPAYDPEMCPGIGSTTPESLYQRWHEDTGRPINPAIGWGYMQIQVIIDAIERAGTLDKEAVNKALAETDLMTIAHRVKFDETQYNRMPLFYGQWYKTDKPWVWECPVVFSKHDFIPATAEPIFPMPYE